jgi:putative tryptophan/tyrosine transport system substrate-binding protein
MRFRDKGIIILAITTVALLAAFGVAACGSSDDGGGGGSASPSASPTETKTFKVGITQIVTHPALDATVKGFKDTLAAAGFTEGENISYDLQNAQGDMATATSIADKFASEDLDLVFAVATPTAQAMAKASTTIPIVFCAVTDPVGAGLVKDAEAPEANVTGVSDMQPVQPILDLAKGLNPKLAAVGAIYNAGESNSVFLIKQEKAAAEAMGLKFVEATAGTSSEVKAAADSLVGRVQAITVIGDNTAVSGLEAIIKVCQENKIPLYAGDTDSVKRGAAAGFGFNYEDLGKQAGAQAAKILNGTPVGDVPVEFASNLILATNAKAAEAMGVTLPQALLDKAQDKY